MFDGATGVVDQVDLPTPTSPSLLSPRPVLAGRLSIAISTFERSACALRLVASIREHYPDLDIIVVDDSASAHRAALTPLLRVNDLRLLYLPYDSGLSAKRNCAVRACDTELIAMFDDDFLVTPATDLARLVAVIDDGLDVVSCTVEHTIPYLHRFRRDGATLHEERGEVGSYRGHPLYGLLLNAFVARTAAIRAVPWDPGLKMHEHGDWFLRVAHLKKTHCADVSIDHRRESPGDYAGLRRAQVVNNLPLRLQRLRARGLNAYDAGDHVIDLTVPAAQPVEPVHVQSNTQQRLERARKLNPIGPRVTPKPAARVVHKSSPAAPSSQTPTPPPPTSRVFEGLPDGFDVSPSPDGLPSTLRALLTGARVLVLGSAPGATLPPVDRFDVILSTNGSGHALPPPTPGDKPLLVLSTTNYLGLEDDQPDRTGLAGYRGRQIAAVLIHGGGWTDYHDFLSDTWYRCHAATAAALAAVGAHLGPAPIIGITPAGRERIVAYPTLNRLRHAVIQPATSPLAAADWDGYVSWRRAGWSTGIIAACLAQFCGARSVILAGVSTGAGHVYNCDGEPRWHLAGDLTVLREVARLGVDWATTDAELATAAGLRVI